MPNDRPAPLDLLALAEDVAAGRRALDNVIDQIAVSIPDDRARRRAVAELGSLVLALTGVRAHARATVEAATRAPREAPAAGSLVVSPRPVVMRRRGPGLAGAFAASATAIAGVIVVAVVVASLRPGPSIGGPEASRVVSSLPTVSQPAATSSRPAPSAPSAASAMPTPGDTAGPTGSPVPTAAAGLPEIGSGQFSGPGLAFWSVGVAPGKLTLWTWNTARASAFADQVDVDVWTDPGTIYQVLVSPAGGRFAVVEHAPGDPASHDRTRVFTWSGQVLWTSPADQPRTIDLAWSNDGTALALGAVPAPWTVLLFGPAGVADLSTYQLPGTNTYRLLAFSPDNAVLYGFETTGEAEFWQKPAALDLARGTISLVDAFPAGLRGNAATAAGQINPDTGDVVATSGGATGDLHWITRHGTVETAVPVDADVQLTWADATTLAELSRVPATSGSGWQLALAPLQPGPGVVPTLNLGAGDYRAGLIGARDRVVLILVAPARMSPNRPPGWTEAVAVEVTSGRTAVGLAPDGAPAGTTFSFAGWISPSAP